MAQRIIDRSYVGEVLQHIHESDLAIDISLSAQRGEFHAVSSDRRFTRKGSSIEEVVTELAVYLAGEFPASAFAHWWSNNFREEDFYRSDN